jgi:DNA invertase Pin-like site-specific DNA recombinase
MSRGNMRRAIGYIRVSTGQSKSGLGIEAQHSAIKKFCSAKGFALSQVITECQTGKGTDALDRRPGLGAAIKAADHSKASIVVARLDQLGHDIHFISELMTLRVQIIVVDLGTHTRPFILHLYAATERKRASNSKRTKGAPVNTKVRRAKLRASKIRTLSRRALPIRSKELGRTLTESRGLSVQR